MAQRKQLSWTELRVGVFVLAGIVLIVLGNFLRHRHRSFGSQIPSGDLSP